MKKKLFFVLLSLVFVVSFGWGWPLLSAGGNVYYGGGAFLFGAGAGFEWGLESCFTSAKTELTIWGVDMEYVGGTFDGDWLDGFVLAFTAKEGFILPPGNLLLGFGFGTGMLTIGYSLGAVVFAEASLYHVFLRAANVCLSLRGGASFIDDAIAPFFGVRVNLGYMFANPEEQDY